MTGPLILQGDARALPLPDESVDLIVTSPPYFGLRDYGVPGQLGAEDSPAEFLAGLLAATREMVRVLRPTGSIFVDLGDKYSGAQGQTQTGVHGRRDMTDSAAVWRRTDPARTGIPAKSLMLLPERYRIACVDQLGLICRAVMIWSKPNGLPESVTDRVRRSHEDWVHLVKQPRYFSAVDEIREAPGRPLRGGSRGGRTYQAMRPAGEKDTHLSAAESHPLGKLPGSVWEIPTQALNVPAELGVDHYAAFPTAWPRRLILGWSPSGICTACGQGRRPVTSVERERGWVRRTAGSGGQRKAGEDVGQQVTHRAVHTITGYACACPTPDAPTRPAVVLDPFGGTGTTALTASVLGRHGITLDLNPEYGRIAAWRLADPRERARAAGLDPETVARIARPDPGQLDLFGEVVG